MTTIRRPTTRPLVAAASLAAAATLAAALGAPAAQAQWSPQQEVPGSQSTLGYSMALDMGAAGTGLIAWNASDGTQASAIVADTPQPAYVLTRLVVDPLRGIVELAGGRVLAFGTTRSVAPGAPGRTYVAEGAIGSPLHSRALSLPSGVFQAAAASPAGNVAAISAACETTSCAHQQLYLTTRRPGRSFTTAQAITLRGAPIDDADVTIDDRGEVLIAWEERGFLYTRIRAASGRLGTTQRLGPAPAPAAIHVILTSGARAVVAWDGETVSEGDPRGTAIVAAAVSRPGALEFAKAQTLERFTYQHTGFYLQAYVPARSIGVVQGASSSSLPDGPVTVAWTGLQAGTFVVRESTLAGSRFGAGQTISDPTADAYLTDLAGSPAATAGPAGDLVALWTTAPRLAGGPDEAHQQVVAAVAPTPPAGVQPTFGAPTPVSNVGANAIAPAGDVGFARVVLDPATQRTLAAWPTLGAIGGHPDLQYATNIAHGTPTRVPG